MTQGRTPDKDSAWEALSEGALSKEEEALLRALAEESEDDAVRLEAYAPLSAEARARTAAKLSAQIKREKRSAVTRRWTVATATVLAAAAAVFMAFWPSAETATRYTLSVQGGVKTVRGATEVQESLRVSDDSVLTLIAQPEQPVREPLTATAFAFDGSAVHLIKGESRTSETGALRVDLRMRDVPFGGHRELQIGLVIDRSQPEAGEIRKRLSQHSPSVLSVRVVRTGN